MIKLKDLGLRISLLYPDLIPGVDYDVRDEGDGPYLKSWITDKYPVPSLDDLSKIHTDDHTVLLKRKRSYPKIEDQLDLLWHAMDSGEIPKAHKWYGEIKKVKNKYPKKRNKK